MATNFNEIYCLNTVIKTDPRLLNKPSYEVGLLNWKYLQFAIKEFFFDCKKDLHDNIPYSSNEYSFVGDGVNNIFSLTPFPSLNMTPSFSVGIQQTCDSPFIFISDYIWDEENKTITLKNIPILNSNIKIICFEEGQFNQDLSNEEKVILADAMNIAFLKETIANRKVLDFSVYGGSIKMHSQAEHAKVMIDNLNEQINIVRGEISDYSYRTASFGYAGLGGRTSCYYQQELRNPTV